jgi:molybdate transport system substrate-binding protein
VWHIRRVFKRAPQVALALLLATACGRPVDEPLHVAAAVSLSDALERASRRYEQATGERLALNFAASNVLSRQIEEGAPIDVFISADERQLERLVVRDLVAAGSVVDLLSNQLVVVTPVGRPLPTPAPGGLLDPAVRRIALGDPAAVPAGVYTRQWLERLDLWSRLEGRIVPSGSVRAALSAVEAGNADAAVVYRTDANGRSSVEVAYLVPIEDAPVINYPACVVASSQAADRARRYLEWLQGSEAGAIFTSAGFRPPPGS